MDKPAPDDCSADAAARRKEIERREKRVPLIAQMAASLAAGGVGRTVSEYVSLAREILAETERQEGV